MTGHNLKQTSLKLRNPFNVPDEWERKVLMKMESVRSSENVGIGEILEVDDKEIYRYMKPVYIDSACLDCHGEREKIIPAIRQYLEKRYSYDEAYDYKERDLRGGISITMPLERLGIGK
ncbi:MAG: Tll0287-like domain-containing protein [Candidatus Scalindua sp.]